MKFYIFLIFMPILVLLSLSSLIMPYRNVLLIDDDDDDHEIFIAAATAASPSVDCTVIADAKEALEKLAAKYIKPDVIFLDLNMPVMNGQQFLIHIKKNLVLKNIPIIIYSTSSHATTIKLTKELGAYDFITKPEKYDDLVSILKRLLS